MSTGRVQLNWSNTIAPGDDLRPISRGVGLTQTQLAIIELIAQGQTDKEIAREVGMSYRTVRTHLERLYELNDVHCRAALVALVVQGRQLSLQSDSRGERDGLDRSSRLPSQ